MPYPSQLVRRIGAAPVTIALLAALMTVSTTSATPTVVGYKDFSYTATSVSDPSQDKPQSKVWFTDGSWWGGLFSPAASSTQIFRLDLASQTWVDTGVGVDPRNNSHADYLWDEASQKLYVASAHPTSDLRVYRFSYNATTNVYSLDAGFPVVVGTAGSESLTIAKDSTDRLWVGFTQPDPADPVNLRNVMINYTTTADQLTWVGPTVLPSQGADKPTFDDIAAIIALGGDRIGIMWSSRTDVGGKTFFYWSERVDTDSPTTWATKKIAASGNTPFAEDHVNLKLATTNSGDVLAAVKTNGSTKNIQLLDYSGTGPWTAYGVFFDPGDQTRPQLVVDDEHGVVYVFATDAEGGGDILYKSAPLSDLLSIETAPIKKFIDGGTELVNNFSTTKQNVNSTTGILGIATSSTNYFHNYLSIAGSTYVPISPARVLDTRTGTGLSGKFTANVARAFGVAGHAGVPANAVAITGNLTVTQQNAAGYVSLTTSLNNNPPTSTINFPLGDTRANNVTIPLGAAGALGAVYKAPAGKTTHLILDVTGYYLDDDSGATYNTVTPARLLDTRAASQVGPYATPFTSNVQREFPVWNQGGVPSTAVAVTGNLTITGQTAGGFVTLSKVNTSTPTTSTINFPLGDTRANGVSVALTPTGSLWAVYKGPTAKTTHVIFDVTGYYVAGTGGLRFFPLNPVRALDGRPSANLGLSGPFSANVSRQLDVDGHLGVPVGAGAITGNLTVTGQTRQGFASITPDPNNNPPTSTINFPIGDNRANGVTVPLNGSGNISLVYKTSSGTTYLLLDIAGYFQ